MWGNLASARVGAALCLVGSTPNTPSATAKSHRQMTACTEEKARTISLICQFDCRPLHMIRERERSGSKGAAATAIAKAMGARGNRSNNSNKRRSNNKSSSSGREQQQQKQ